MRHTWKLDETGEIDLWVLDFEFHNGPFCTACYESFCIHCAPSWAKLEDCAGAELDE